MGPDNRPGHGQLPEDEVFILVAAVRVNSVAFLGGLFNKKIYNVYLNPESFNFFDNNVRYTARSPRWEVRIAFLALVAPHVEDLRQDGCLGKP
jgi:hypothetical protein